MAHIANIDRRLAERILSQYAMTPAQIEYALDWATECMTFEGEHNGYPLKITSDGTRFTIIR